jgi:hypothetical protein
MFGQSLLSAFGIACTTDTDQLFTTDVQTTSTATYQLNSGGTSIPSNTYPLTTNGITFASGKFGNAAGFSSGNASTGDYMKVSNSIYGSSTTVFSWSLWIKCDNTTGTGINIMGNGALAGGQTGYTVYLYNGRLALSTLQSSDQYFPNPESNGTLINDNQWHNIVLTYNNGSFVLYLDGSPNQTGTSSNYINNATPASDTYIGNSFQRGISDGIVNGQIDQVRVFGGTILNQDAVTALYNETTTTATYPYITTEVANPNSIAYYKMSDATDQLGNYNGTATNVNFNTEGKFGFAGSFNGSSSKIEIIPSPQDNSGVMSVSFWAKTSSTSRTAFFIAEAPNPNKEFLKLENFGYNGTNSFRVTYNNSFSANINNAAISDNNWHHIVVTAGNGNLKTYKDNVLLATHSITITDQTLDAFAIGFRKYNNDLYFDGEIDQVRIYDAVLSAADVSTLYKEVECKPAAINALANFNTVLYTGTGSSQSITNVGFAPNFVWIKDRDAANWHNLQDTIRGATKHVYSNAPNAEDTTSDGLTSFDSDGFTIGGGGGFGNNGNNFVAWNWKAGGTAVSNTDGSITSTVTANVEAGFSIVSYTATGSTATVGHGLGTAPDLILAKTSNQAYNWIAYSSALGSSTQLLLDSSNAAQTGSSIMASTDPTSTVFTAGAGNNLNYANGNTIIAYCFKSIPGYSKVGSYIGQTAGVTIYTGFQPRFIMVKASQATYPENWAILDAVRGSGKCLNPNLSNAETDSTLNTFTTTATGFSFPHQNTADAMLNENGYKYIFLAIA